MRYSEFSERRGLGGLAKLGKAVKDLGRNIGGKFGGGNMAGGGRMSPGTSTAKQAEIPNTTPMMPPTLGNQTPPEAPNAKQDGAPQQGQTPQGQTSDDNPDAKKMIQQQKKLLQQQIKTTQQQLQVMKKQLQTLK